MSKKENIEPRNSKGQLHGFCICYYDNGNVWCKQRFVNSKYHGLRERYCGDGELLYKRYWLNGKSIYR